MSVKTCKVCDHFKVCKYLRPVEYNITVKVSTEIATSFPCAYIKIPQLNLTWVRSLEKRALEGILRSTHETFAATCEDYIEEAK